MAFVANARPEAPKRLRQGESFDPAPRGKSDTHACSLNKGIGCKSRTRKESAILFVTYESEIVRQQGRIPKVAVFLKYCFPCKVNLVRGKNRSLEGLSWPGEKAEAMRLCRRAVCTRMDKSEDLQTTEIKETCAKSAGRFGI